MMRNAKRWLSALAFTFLILAGLLGWDAYRAFSGRGRALAPWQMYAEAILAVFFLALFMAGVRIRHQGQT